jgi:hypothetical protein
VIRGSLRYLLLRIYSWLRIARPRSHDDLFAEGNDEKEGSKSLFPSLSSVKNSFMAAFRWLSVPIILPLCQSSKVLLAFKPW